MESLVIVGGVQHRAEVITHAYVALKCIYMCVDI